MPLTEIVVLVSVAAVLVIGVASFFARRIGVAAPLVLVVIGIGLGAIPGAQSIHIEPEVILTVVLPPLLFAAARQVPFTDFQRNFRVIVFLALALVAVSAVLVGVLVHVLWPAVPLALAIALGAVVAPPDAVAATSLGKRIGLPPRIVTILEGEGLINDAAALVILATALGIVASGQDINGGGVALTFVWSIVGASLIGWLMGWATVEIRRRVSDAVLDAAISLVLPFLAYLAAELVGSSGVVAVVVAGIVVGNFGVFTIPAAARRNETSTWQLITMILENGVFLYMGLQLWSIVGEVTRGPGSIYPALGMIALVTVLLVLLRFAVMPSTLWSIRRRLRRTEKRLAEGRDRMEQGRARMPDADDERTRSRLQRFGILLERRENDLTAERDQALGWRDAIILGMAGMRGVVTVAAAQTLPGHDADRAALVLVAYGVAVVTLLAQGLALPAVVRRLRPKGDVEMDQRRETAELRAKIQAAGDAEVERQIRERDDVPQLVADELRNVSETRNRQWDVWGQSDLQDPHGPAAVFLEIRRRELEVERTALQEERVRAHYSSEALAFVGDVLDSIELQTSAYWSSTDD